MRDKESKEDLIEYLKNSNDERLWQAITNWSGFPFIGRANDQNGKDFEDLWHR